MGLVFSDMKKLSIVFVVLGIFALYVILPFVATAFKCQFDWGKLGPMGDMFGGLLSPIIGGVSILYIYKTFKAQKKQLKDQKKTNRAIRGGVFINFSVLRFY